jgi:hypothetical protein
MKFTLCLLLIIAVSSSQLFAEELPTEPIQEAGDQTRTKDLRKRVSRSLDTTRWKSYRLSSTEGYWYYDTLSIKRENDKAVVWTTMYPAKGYSEFLKAAHYKQEEIDKVDRVVFVTEFQCSERAYVQPTLAAYDWLGNEISYSSVSEMNFKGNYIEPESSMDSLIKVACRSSKKSNE